MVTLFGLFASHSVELQNDLLSYFGDFLPPDAFHLLRTTAIELAANASEGMLTFGIVVALWFASGGVSSMISALNLAYRVRERRPWLQSPRNSACIGAANFDFSSGGLIYCARW